ncbi:Myeloid differentiation primary response protein MyD88, partial [Stegodyphus mimosarum]
MEEGTFNQTPITALSLRTRMKIALFLNPPRELLSHEKVPGDYRGLAELMQFAYIEIQNFGTYQEPTMKLLDTWGKRQGATFGKLMELLQELQRYDLLAQVVPLLEEDAAAYQRRIHMQRNGQHLIQDPEVTSGDSLNSSQYLTVDDFLSGESTLYHAFMLHSDAPEDVSFAIELTRKLESEGMKIFLRNR